MTRMKVEIKAPEPLSSIMNKMDEFEAFTHFHEHYESLEPTDANLGAFDSSIQDTQITSFLW